MIATAALAAGLASGAQAATIVNGSFENSTVDPNSDPNHFVTLAPGSTAIDGWLVGPGSIDYIGTYWQAQDGGRSIDLNGTSPGTISQMLDSLAGQYYTISFYASKNPDGGDPNRVGTVSFGGNTATFEYGLPNDRTNMNWQLYTYTFLGNGNDVLSFAGDGTTGACCFGPALDNANISNAPEPSTWAMLLLGFVGIGMVMRRKRTPALAQLA